MSRIGQAPVAVPDGVDVTVQGRTVAVKGKLGETSIELPDGITARVDDGRVVLERPDETRDSKSFHGLARSLVANMVEGVAKGYSRDLEINGVGFRAAVNGRQVSLSLGFASPLEYTVPDGVNVETKDGTTLTVSGIDKQKVGDVAARIRSFFPAEPYKGKGIQYKGERIRRKVGKTVA